MLYKRNTNIVVLSKDIKRKHKGTARSMSNGRRRGTAPASGQERMVATMHHHMSAKCKNVQRQFATGSTLKRSKRVRRQSPDSLDEGQILQTAVQEWVFELTAAAHITQTRLPPLFAMNTLPPRLPPSGLRGANGTFPQSLISFWVSVSNFKSVPTYLVSLLTCSILTKGF